MLREGVEEAGLVWEPPGLGCLGLGRSTAGCGGLALPVHGWVNITHVHEKAATAG